jgi:hypothetical protein
MKFYTDNETVHKAFGDPLLKFGIPSFFGAFFILIIIGFVFKLHPVITLFLSFVVSFSAWYILIQKWFEKYIKTVTDPAEFYERSLRQGMIMRWSADRIVKRNNIDVSRRITPYRELETTTISEGFNLTNEFITINNEEFRWKRIKRYDLKSKRSTQFSHFLTFTFTDNTQLHLYIKVDDGGKFDYLLDKYLSNSRALSV